MKIGIIIKELKSDAISGSHFEQAILREIDSKKYLDKEFYVFTYSNIYNINIVHKKNIKYVYLPKYVNFINKTPSSFSSKALYKILTNKISCKILPKKITNYIKISKVESPLTSALKMNNIDICWNIYSTEMVDIPYIATCLDCYDITDPYLPENNRPNYWLNWNNFSFHYYRRASYVLASTNVLKEQLKSFYGLPQEKIIINPFFTPNFEGIETTFQSETIKKENIRRGYLFYPSRYTPQKNHIVIIEALKILKESSNLKPDVIFCGRDLGNLEYINSKIVEYGLSDQFTILNVVDFQTLIHLYKNAKALVYSSLVGPDNLPPLEAFSFNCPVIASNVSGAIEQLGDAALLFEPTDEKKLAECIDKVYNNHDLVADLVVKGKKIHNSLNVQNYISKIIDLLDDFQKYRRCWK